MSFLPELDSDGRIKKPKQQIAMSGFVCRRKKIDSPRKSFLNWENLLDKLCPKCGGDIRKENDRYICRNHNGSPFIIPEFKFIKICRDLQGRNDFKMPRF